MESASGEQLGRAVSRSLPHFNLPSKDLAQNPNFTRLLLSLTTRMDNTGLSLPIKRELEKASGELRARRRQWLMVEVLERSVDELLTQRQAGRHEGASKPQDQEFFDTLDRCWVLGRSQRLLDVRGAVTDTPLPPLLGIERKHLNQLQPQTKEVLAMRRRLVIEVEQCLSNQCLALFSIVWPECDGQNPGQVLGRGEELKDWIEAQQLRLDLLRDQDRLQQVTLGKQSLAGLMVLSRCFQLLRILTETHRLCSQPELDQSLQEYLKLKSRAMFTKLRLMRLELQHEVFSEDVVGAHQQISEELREALSAEESRAQTLRGRANLFRLLGPEFELLVQEYGRLRTLLDNRRWALCEISPTSGPGERAGSAQ